MRREEYSLLRIMQAREMPAALDPMFQNAQSWEALSILGVFGDKTAKLSSDKDCVF